MSNSLKANNYLPSHQSGMTLVELLIAIALGIFLSWGAIQAFLSGKQSYSLQQALSRIQENTRTAQELIGYDVRNAGDYGCASGRQVYIPLATAGTRSTAEDPNMLAAADKAKAEFNFAYAVQAFDASAASAQLKTALSPAPLANTEVLVVHTAANLGAYTKNTPSDTQFDVSGAANSFKPNDYLAVSNCARTSIIQANAGTAGNTVTVKNASGNKLPEVPPVNASVMKLDAVIYYIANNPAGEPALYRRTLADGATSQELLSGIENLQVEIGVDSNNDGAVDTFKAPGAVTAAEWNAWDDTQPTVIPNPVTDYKALTLMDANEANVVAVRYSLLMRSSDGLLEAPQPYTYNGSTVTPTDKRMRQVVTSTVGIRSRLSTD